MDIFAARMNCEEKGRSVDIVAAQMNRQGKKDKTVGFQPTNKKSVVKCYDLLYIPHSVKK